MNKKVKKKYLQTRVMKLKKNQNYGSNNKIKNKSNFDKKCQEKKFKTKILMAKT